MGPVWQARLYGPVGCLVPLLAVLVALMGIGVWTVIGWVL